MDEAGPAQRRHLVRRQPDASRPAAAPGSPPRANARPGTATSGRPGRPSPPAPRRARRRRPGGTARARRPGSRPSWTPRPGRRAPRVACARNRSTTAGSNCVPAMPAGDRPGRLRRRAGGRTPRPGRPAAPAGPAGRSPRRAGGRGCPCRPTARTPAGSPRRPPRRGRSARRTGRRASSAWSGTSTTCCCPVSGKRRQPPGALQRRCRASRPAGPGTTTDLRRVHVEQLEAVALERDVVAEPAAPARPRRRGSRRSSSGRGSRSPRGPASLAPTRSASRSAITVCRMQCSIGCPSPRSAA